MGKWIFPPEMTPAQFPKSDLWNFCWILFPEMTLAHFPEFGFFCPEFTDKG